MVRTAQHRYPLDIFFFSITLRFSFFVDRNVFDCCAYVV